MSAALQYIPKIRPEPFEYLNQDQRWGSFSVVSRQVGGRWARQRSYPLSQLTHVLSECTDTQKDYWISQASFNGFNRRKVNLHSIGLAFVDLDYYNLDAYYNLSPEKMLFDHVFPLLQAKNVPLPSLVLDSGQGMQIKWYTENLPARALPRWDRLQTELVSLLEGLGGDKKAKDASRILRLEGTYNQKSGVMAKVLWSDVDKDCLPVRHVFGDLCDSVLPYTQERLEQLRAAKAKAKAAKACGTRFNVRQSSSADIIKMLSRPNALTLENLNWHRLHDLKKLIRLRGGVEDGMRELFVFYMCNFYALRYAQSGVSDMHVWQEFSQLAALAAPHWGQHKIRSKVTNVFELMKRTSKGEMQTWQEKEVPLLYVPKNDTMIDLFGISMTEQKEMTTIIGAEEKRCRNTARHEVARRKSGAQTRSEYVYVAAVDADNRMQRVLMLSSQGYKQAEIAKLMDITVNAVKSLKKRALAARS